MKKEQNYELRWEDLAGIFPYALRNIEIPNEEISKKVLIRAIPLTFYTIAVSLGAVYGTWKGLESLIQ